MKCFRKGRIINFHYCVLIRFVLCPRYPVDSDGRCVGESFQSCDDEDPKSVCVGRAFRAYFYEFNRQPTKHPQHPKKTGGGYGIFSLFSTVVSIFKEDGVAEGSP